MQKKSQLGYPDAVSIPLNETKLETPLSLTASTGLVNSPRKDQVSFFSLSKDILYELPYENIMGKKYNLGKSLNPIIMYYSENTQKECFLQF